MHGSYNVTVVQSIFPTFLLLTIVYYWKSSYLLSQMSFACYNISVTVFKGKTSDVVILEQIPDPFRPFSHALEQLLYLSSIMQITLARKWKVHEYNGPVFTHRRQKLYLYSRSDRSRDACKSKRSKRDEHLSLTFHRKQGKMFHFSCLVKCDVPKRNTVTQFFLAFLASITQIIPTKVKSSRRQGVDYHAHIAYRLKKET